jgi:hypothetical protein
MIKVTVEFPTAEDAIEGLARLRGVAGIAGVVKPETAKDKTESPKKEAAAPAPKAEKVAASPSTAPAPAAAAPKVEASSAGSTADGYEPVGAAISAAAKTNRAAVVATLAEFSAKSGKDLKPEQYAPFTAALTEALKPAEDLG